MYTMTFKTFIFALHPSILQSRFTDHAGDDGDLLIEISVSHLCSHNFVTGYDGVAFGDAAFDKVPEIDKALIANPVTKLLP